MWLKLYEDEIERDVFEAGREEWKAEMLRLGFRMNRETSPVHTLWENWK